MSCVVSIPECYLALENNKSSQERFQNDMSDLLDEVGNILRRNRVIREYEIDSFPPSDIDPGEVTCTYYNRRHDRSAFVWIGETIKSNRADGLVCQVRLWGKRDNGKPDSDHITHLSKPQSVDIELDAICEKVKSVLMD